MTSNESSEVRWMKAKSSNKYSIKALVFSITPILYFNQNRKFPENDMNSGLRWVISMSHSLWLIGMSHRTNGYLEDWKSEFQNSKQATLICSNDWFFSELEERLNTQHNIQNLYSENLSFWLFRHKLFAPKLIAPAAY